MARLLELFASRSNVLVKPRKWEDPFENFILNSRIPSHQEGFFDHGNRDAVYGQFWTRQAASDAMWQIYSPNATQ